jgi:hypothetical protein
MQTENTYIETDLGNIALNPRGEYSDEASYEYLDTVSYKGGSYMCLAELTKTISGIAPVQGKNTEYWQILTLPGQLTPGAIAMHDDIVNKSKQVETSRAAVELSQQAVEDAQVDVRQMRQDTQEASESAIASRDAAAGYAQAAEASRTAAAESEQNINAQVNNFNTHVSEKTSVAEASIEEARKKAIDAVTTQQDLSIKAVTDEETRQTNAAIKAVTTQQNNSVQAIADEASEQIKKIKDSLDKGLSEEGKAADAKATGDAISVLKEDLGNLNMDNNAGQSLTSEKDISGKRVIINMQYKLLGFNADDYYTCKIYKITKNKKYYAIGYGKKNESWPVAVFSENLVEDGTTPYTDYILGELSTISLSKVSFIAKNDGYIYVNCRNAACGLYENIVIPESTKNANDIKNIEKYKLATYGEFENVNIDIKKGFLYNVLSKEEKTFDNFRYCKLEIDDTIDMIKATGYSFQENSEYPFICFLDEYGNIIETYGEPSTGYNDCLMKIPYRTKSIIVNGNSKITIQKFVLKENLAQEIKELSSPVTMDRLKGMKVLNEKYESKTIEISENEILSEIVYTDSGNQSTSDSFSTVIIPIELSLKSIKILYSVGVYGGAFLDNQKKWISSFSTESNGLIYDVPDYATYIGYTFANGRTSFQLGVTFNVYTSEQLTLQGNSFFVNPWEGKKVVLLGTSVGFGSGATKSYMQEASNYLGFTLVNTSVPGLAIHTNADGKKLTYGSTCLSVAEYKEQGMTIPDAPKDYVPGGSYNDYYRTWEHIFSSENADADLWLYAVAPNNGNFKLDDWNSFDKSNWKYTDESSFASHRTTFLGALLYLMDKMYTLNPNARMAFILDSAFAYGDAEGKGNLKKVSDQWGIPLVDLWGKINRSPKSLEVIKSENGTNNHPSTFGHEKMGMMMVGEMLRLG